MKKVNKYWERQWLEEISRFQNVSNAILERDRIIKTIDYYKRELKFLENQLVLKQQALKGTLKKNKIILSSANKLVASLD